MIFDFLLCYGPLNLFGSFGPLDLGEQVDPIVQVQKSLQYLLQASLKAKRVLAYDQENAQG